jgi:hypothetical protein
MGTRDQLLYSDLHRTAMRYTAEKGNLAESIEELRQIADGPDDILAEAAGLAAGTPGHPPTRGMNSCRQAAPSQRPRRTRREQGAQTVDRPCQRISQLGARVARRWQGAATLLRQRPGQPECGFRELSWTLR